MQGEFTLLYTDLVGSTAVNTHLGDADMDAWWNRHDRGYRDLLRQWHGREIDRSDGFAVLFEKVADGAAFANAYHRMLAALPVPVPARAGLHVGALTLRANSEDDVALGAKPFDVMGLARAVSARLMALGQGGQTLVSAAAAQALTEHGQACVAHGHFRLKGVPDPQPVYELVGPLAPLTPPPDTEKAQRVVQVDGHWVGLSDVPRHLPAEHDAFEGRTAELRQLSQALQSGQRLVTLHGPGGMGKSRLALRHGWGWLGQYPGGVWWVDLAQGGTDLPAVLAHTAQALGQTLPAGPPGLQLQALGQHLDQLGPALLLLDHAETCAAATAQAVLRWLAQAPQLRCLVVTRERLGLPGEQLLSLGPLGTDDAVALFHRRAAAHPAHQPADWPAAEHQALRRLVEALEGMPLALELAAARASVMRPSALLERLNERFKLLAVRGGPVGRPSRQASLQATLDASWVALAPDEQAVLAQLAVFEGGFDASAAQAVVQVPSESGAWLPDLLQALQDKALLQTGSGGRFSLLRCVREHAATHVGADVAAATRARHALHFSQRSERDAAAHHGLDLHNLMQACRHSVAGSQAELAARTLPLAWAALRLVGPFHEAVTLADAVLALPGLDADAQAAVWAVKAGASFAQGDMQAAGQAARQGLQAAEAGHDTAATPTLARLLCVQGEVAAAEGQRDLAEHCLAEARRLAEACGDPATVCHALNSQGSLAFDGGQADEARALYEAGLTVATDARDHRWQCGLLSNLGAIHHQAGRLDEARDAFERALRFAQACGDQRFAGNARCNLGLVHHDQGRLADAERELQATLETARQLGQHALEHGALCNLGMVLSAQGRHELACDLHADAVDGARATGNLHAEGVYRTYLGTALARTGRFDEARACLRRGRELLAQANDAMNLGLLLCAVAECEQLARDWQDAEQALEEARGLLNQHGWPAESELARRLEAVARNAVGGTPPALTH